jgi:hypothetical protein
MTLTYQIVYWRDIPSQVKVRAGRERVSRMLPDRFQEAIDEAAILARATRENEYLEQWRSTEWQEAGRPGSEDPRALAAQLAGELDRSFPPERLDEFVQNKGYAIQTA